MQLLFESRIEITRLDGKIRWVQNRPSISAEPVLHPDNAGDGAGASIYGSVLRDNGMYRMWYQGWPRDWDGTNSAIVCYAESDDGITWRKPQLKLDARFAAPNNVTDLGLHAPAVFIDPDAPPTHRYRATGHAVAANVGANPNLAGNGYRTAHSADGLHWQLDQPEPTWDGSDVITSVYHPGQRRAIVALKQNVRHAAIRRRAIWSTQLRDGQWDTQHAALIPDTLDDAHAQSRGLASGDYYGMAMQPAGDGTVGFIWQFRHSLPRTTTTAGDGAGVFGVVDVSLAYQPDAKAAWQHAPGRIDFINNGDIPWRPGGCIYTAAAPVDVGDEHRLYLCATYPHGYYITPEWDVIEDIKQSIIAEGISRIGYAAWPKHRLFGYRGEPVGSFDLNLGRRDRPFKLLLNCEPHTPNARTTVAVRGSETHTHDHCRPITESASAAEVTWQAGPVITPTADAPTVVNVNLTESTCYAWDVADAR